ncbi:MAG: hypothetical protein VYE64_05900 [Planctomycetota bacterium]|nr:hypothetical protein [Planctomycetota bacterium]
MKTASLRSLLFTLFVVLVTVEVAHAQLKLPFRSSRTSTSQTTGLTQTDGPWLIMCASFVGEQGEKQARLLASELKQHKFKTYIYRHTFDYSDPIEGIGWKEHTDQEGDTYQAVPKTMKVAGTDRFEEIAVLVGDFASIEDSRAQRALEKIKSMKVASISEFDPKSEEGQRLRFYREMVKMINKNGEAKTRGPLCAAFLLPNPMLPDEYFNMGTLDSFVMDLNKGIKHSLLDCPALYTVRVATFRGDSTFELSEIEAQQSEQRWRLRFKKPVKDKESKLAVATAKAHRLTAELRKMGVEAYVFHDRFESYVCIGSFDWIKQDNQQNPQVVKLINSYKANVEDLPGIPGAVRPRTVPSLQKFDIAFDPQPVPVLVPKPQQTHTSSLLDRFR